MIYSDYYKVLFIFIVIFSEHVQDCFGNKIFLSKIKSSVDELLCDFEQIFLYSSRRMMRIFASNEVFKMLHSYRCHLNEYEKKKEKMKNFE